MHKATWTEEGTQKKKFPLIKRYKSIYIVYRGSNVRSNHFLLTSIFLHYPEDGENWSLNKNKLKRIYKVH
jgi:hypothetical protein